MASYFVQADTSLYLMTQAGVATALALPAGVTVYGPAIPCRVSTFGAGQDPVVIVTRGVSQDFWIDTFGVTHLLAITPPAAPPAVAAGTGTGLTGVYQVALTNKLKDAFGRTLLESAPGPSSTGSASLVNQSLKVTSIPTSGDPNMNARGLYRSLSGGTVLYPWFDIDNNTDLSEDRAIADATLSLLPTTAGSNGAPPNLGLLISWKDRLWGVPLLKLDSLRWSEERLFYAWPQVNEIIIPPRNTDAFGVTALIPRRDQLGIARRNRLYQITGESNDTFQRAVISETLGCMSQESVVVVRDTAYFLGERGVVQWDAQSVGYISEAQVDRWFISDDYFNRAKFSSAQGRYNADTDSYELLLMSAGSSTLDRWISFDLKRRVWLGPHTTAEFTLSAAASSDERHGWITDTNRLPLSVFGSTSGFLYKRDPTVANDGASAVTLNIDTPFLSGDPPEPELTKIFLQMTAHSRIETGGSLIITPIVGNLNSATGTAITHDVTTGRERLARLGQGRYLQLNLSHSTASQFLRLHGLVIPYITVGRR